MADSFPFSSTTFPPLIQSDIMPARDMALDNSTDVQSSNSSSGAPSINVDMENVTMEKSSSQGLSASNSVNSPSVHGPSSVLDVNDALELAINEKGEWDLDQYLKLLGTGTEEQAFGSLASDTDSNAMTSKTPTNYMFPMEADLATNGSAIVVSSLPNSEASTSPSISAVVDEAFAVASPVSTGHPSILHVSTLAAPPQLSNSLPSSQSTRFLTPIPVNGFSESTVARSQVTSFAKKKVVVVPKSLLQNPSLSPYPRVLSSAGAYQPRFQARMLGGRGRSPVIASSARAYQGVPFQDGHDRRLNGQGMSQQQLRLSQPDSRSSNFVFHQRQRAVNTVVMTPNGQVVYRPPAGGNGPRGLALPSFHHQRFQQRSSSMQTPPRSFLTLRQQPNQAQLDDEFAEEDAEHLEQAEAYVNYVPAKLRLGVPHPDPVVESSTLNNVEPPDITYQLCLPSEIISEGHLSSLQLEGVVYACQRHQCFLPNGERAAFLIGDGAGVGKGRMLAAIILENWLRGKRRFIWLSVSNDLKEDAERDLADLNASHIRVYALNRLKYGKINGRENGHIRKGVIFGTYASLIGQSTVNPKKNNRLNQLVRWFRKEGDGVILIDECHRAKNLSPNMLNDDAGGGQSGPGDRSAGDKNTSSRTGMVLRKLLAKCPRARVVYASATGASEPRHLAYMGRLGLWSSTKNKYVKSTKVSKQSKAKPSDEIQQSGQSLTPTSFEQFMRTILKGGVLAMEMVAMSMKASGMYCARQLSFRGVKFDVMEVPIEKVRAQGNISFGVMYDEAAMLWQDLRTLFIHALSVLMPDKKHQEFRKTALNQFYSSHQRFFKYLCISAKVDKCVQLTKDAIRNNKCVIIGLQSTGEARTQDLVNEAQGDVQEFMSTCLGVLLNFLNKYFPTRKHVDEFYKSLESRQSNASNRKETQRLKKSQSSASLQPKDPTQVFMDAFGEDKVRDILSRGKRGGAINRAASSNNVSSDSENSEKSEDNEDDEDDEDDDEEDDEEEEDEDDEDEDSLLFPVRERRKRRKQHRYGKSTGFSGSKRAKVDDASPAPDKEDSNVDSDDSDKWDLDQLYGDEAFRRREYFDDAASSNLGGSGSSPGNSDVCYNQQRAKQMEAAANKPNGSSQRSSSSTSRDNVFLTGDIPPLPPLPFPAEQQQWSEAERSQYCEQLMAHLKARIDRLGPYLPLNTLDYLIDQLGGASEVAEMTGRKYRIEMNSKGECEVKNRCTDDTTMEHINLHEKELFMRGEKLIAIISEAASSGISLQADRRVNNRRQRLHITLELPWSADRAVQQFGRTHRSNQCVPPQYVFLISNLPGERRFATTVAQRLQSLGALTQGDRRVTETRGDLCTTFHIDEQVGRDAAKQVLQTLEHYWRTTPGAPSSYRGPLPVDWPELTQDFISNVRHNLEGVGLLNIDGVVDRDAFHVNKFFNRLLGMRISVQNQLFHLFSTTLDRLMELARKEGRLDRGIMDLDASVTQLKLISRRKFCLASNMAELMKLDLLTMTAERGCSWDQARDLFWSTKDDSPHDPPGPNSWGFFMEKRSSGIQLPLLAVKATTEQSRPAGQEGSAAPETLYTIYRPMEGRLPRRKPRSAFQRYNFVAIERFTEVEEAWRAVFEATTKQCMHFYLRITCPNSNSTSSMSGNNRFNTPSPASTGTNTAAIGKPAFQGCLRSSRLREYNVLTGGALLQLWTSMDDSLREKLKQYVRFRVPAENVADTVAMNSSPQKSNTQQARSSQYSLFKGGPPDSAQQKEFRGIGLLIPRDSLALVMKLLHPLDPNGQRVIPAGSGALMNAFASAPQLAGGARGGPFPRPTHYQPYPPRPPSTGMAPRYPPATAPRMNTTLMEEMSNRNSLARAYPSPGGFSSSQLRPPRHSPHPPAQSQHFYPRAGSSLGPRPPPRMAITHSPSMPQNLSSRNSYSTNHAVRPSGSATFHSRAPAPSSSHHQSVTRPPVEPPEEPVFFFEDEAS